jgi:phytoene desaturase
MQVIPVVRPLPAADRSSAPHAVVIGSGLGGLAAAIRLGAKGYRVTVLERLDRPGGRARVFRQDGFTFDAGPTIVTAPFLLEELWALCGERFQDYVELRALDPFYRIRFDDGAVLDYSGDPTHMRREIARFAPGDVAGFDAFMRTSEEIFRIGFEQLGHVPFNSFMDMVRILPDLLRLQGHRSVHGLVARYIKDPRLRTVLSFHPLLVGGNPFRTTSVYALIAFLERRWGVHFAMGGTGRLVSGMVELIRKQGNEVRCGVDVAEISIENGRAAGVVLADGTSIQAATVVSNADAAWTYRYLLRKQARRRWTDRRIDRARYSMSLFVWYFGTRRRYDNVAHHTLLLGPRYKALLEDIFERKVLAKDFSLYLHRPTATDPTLAPEGCDAFYVLSPVPHLESGIDWTKEGERYRAAIMRHLEATILPDLSQQIATSRLLTPQHFQDELLSYRGAAFGMEPVLTQSAWFRPHNRSEDVPGLYLVGAGTHPGAGLPGVLSSARILDGMIPDAASLH